MKWNALRERISRSKVVSFDVFDTLIVRPYEKPTDLFRHLEAAERMPGFSTNRIKTEISLREQQKEAGIFEVTLEDIYAEMSPPYNTLKHKEVLLEKRVCRANPEMYAIFQFALQQNKKIIIASDMYLPLNILEEILSGAGYTGYEKIFLSSQTKRPKWTGDMYADILQYCDVWADKVLHIGDNRFTDYDIALESGLQAYLYTPIHESHGELQNGSYFATLNRYSDDSVVPSILQGLIALHEVNSLQEDYWTS